MLTAEMLSGLQASITKDLGILVPVGVGVMGLMVSLRLIPRVIYSFL